MLIGLREVDRSLRAGRVKYVCLCAWARLQGFFVVRWCSSHTFGRMVVCAPNIDEGRKEGGLDDKVGQIIALAREHDVPVVFALNRRKLGKAISRKVRVSVVGILNFDGSDGVHKKVLPGRCASCMLPNC